VTDIERVWTDSVYDDQGEFAETLARRIVDRLVIAAAPVFKMHAGDLIFDYLWLLKHARPADGPEVTPMWWAWDECGTCIGQDRDLVARHRGSGLYKIAIPEPIRHRVDIIITREVS
jgi:hypothetical protein